jgi:hypothetical protein
VALSIVTKRSALGRGLDSTDVVKWIPLQSCCPDSLVKMIRCSCVPTAFSAPLTTRDDPTVPRTCAPGSIVSVTSATTTTCPMRTKGEPSWVHVVSCSIRPDTVVWERAAGTRKSGMANKDASRKGSDLLTTTRTLTRLGSCLKRAAAPSSLLARNARQTRLPVGNGVRAGRFWRPPAHLTPTPPNPDAQPPQRIPEPPSAPSASSAETRARLAHSLHPPQGRIDGPNGPMGHWRSGDAPEWNDPANDAVR